MNSGSSTADGINFERRMEIRLKWEINFSWAGAKVWVSKIFSGVGPGIIVIVFLLLTIATTHKIPEFALRMIRQSNHTGWLKCH